MLSAKNLHCAGSEKSGGIGVGGIGASHLLTECVRLQESLDERLGPLKRCFPHHESDRVLDIAYHVLGAGGCLEDIGLLRQDETYLHALDAEGLQDATTKRGTICVDSRGEESVAESMECANNCPARAWSGSPIPPSHF